MNGLKKKFARNELTLSQKAVNAIVLLIFFLIMAVPMWNVLVLSTSTALDASASGIKMWWNQFSLEGYEYVFSVTKLGRPFLNSIFVSVVGTLLQVILSAFAGYVLIQRDLPGKKIITSFILVTMMIPGDLTIISIYQLNKQLNLTNTYAGLILNGLISGFSILLMRNYFLSVPYSLAESGRVDGASEYAIFFKLYLPVSKPGLATVFFMEFVSKWNSITIPATIITDRSMYTLPLMLKALIVPANESQSGGVMAPPNAVMAAVVISTIPLLFIYAFAQKFLLSGMTVGASKE